MITVKKWSYGSGKLLNPGKHYFLALEAAALRDFNLQRDGDRLSFA